MTTAPDEVAILEQALTKAGAKMEIEDIECRPCPNNGEELEICADGSDEMFHMSPSDAQWLH